MNRAENLFCGRGSTCAFSTVRWPWWPSDTLRRPLRRLRLSTVSSLPLSLYLSRLNVLSDNMKPRSLCSPPMASSLLFLPFLPLFPCFSSDVPIWLAKPSQFMIGTTRNTLNHQVRDDSANASSHTLFNLF